MYLKEGEKMFVNKLTDKDVYEVLYLHKIKKLQPHEIAESFPVTKQTIKSIVAGKSRKDCYFAFIDYMENHPRKVKTLFK